MTRTVSSVLLALTLVVPLAPSQDLEQVKEYRKPTLVVSAYPTLQIIDIGHGCSPVLITARLAGPEDEKWYCPKVRWIKPDGTVAVEESDCPPFEHRNECWPPQGPKCAPGWYRDGRGAVVEYPECSCTVIGYPRVWKLPGCWPQHPYGETWEVTVRLERSGRLLAQDVARFSVK